MGSIVVYLHNVMNVCVIVNWNQSECMHIKSIEMSIFI